MKRPLALLLLFLLFAVAACTPAAETAPPTGPGDATPTALTLTSPDFTAGEPIPAAFTCQGSDSSPALEWSAPPPGTQSLALIMDDPDAPAGTWVHWVVYNLPSDSGGLPQSASAANASSFELPPGALQGPTSFRRSDYGGPCPPSGTHRYYFRLYALDTVIDQPGHDKSALLETMEGHVLAMGELMGTYARQ